jgi:hypothetical protein
MTNIRMLAEQLDEFTTKHFIMAHQVIIVCPYETTKND